MKTSSPSRVVLFALLMIILPLLITCGGKNDEATTNPSPTMKAGYTMVYNQKHLDQTEILTVTVVGEEVVDGIDCYEMEFVPDKPMTRSVGGVEPVYVPGYTVWTSKAALETNKIEVIIETTSGVRGSWEYTYSAHDTEAHVPPLSIGQSWKYDVYTDYGLLDTAVITWKCEVAAVEEITVPAGIFNCYRLEHSRESAHGEKLPEEGLRSMVWLSMNEDFFGIVKLENYSQGSVKEEIRELVSFSE